MALTELALANKRTRKVMRRRSLKRGRRTSAPSRAVAWFRTVQRLDAEELARRNEQYEAQRLASLEAVRLATKAKRVGFVDKVKSGLLKMLPRRTGGAD